MLSRTKPAVSVILPVRNGADTLDAALDSILNQTDPDFELIAVDDGSTDDTPGILAVRQARDRRIRIHTHRRSRGIVRALNAGLARASGDLIARMDADDVSHPDRLCLQRQYLAGNSGIGLVGTRVVFGGDRETHAGYAAYVDWTNSVLTTRDISVNRFVESPFAHPSVMFRKALVDRYGAYSEGQFPEDYELWLRWLAAGVRMAKIPGFLLTWNDPPDRLSRTDDRYSFRAFYRCKAEYLAQWLAQENRFHPRILIWGAGRETRKRAEFLTEHGIEIVAYVDIDPRKIGNVVHGRPVLSEEEIPKPGTCFVVSYVASRGAREDIRGRLRRAGHSEKKDFIMGA